MNTIYNYPAFVNLLCKKPTEVIDTLNSSKLDKIASFLCWNSSKEPAIADFKKHIFYGQPARFSFGETTGKTLSLAQIDLFHCLIGKLGETMEMLLALENNINGQEFDHGNFIEELGDDEFYTQRLRSILGVTREQVIEGNIRKLEKRYPNGYSNAAAEARLDKVNSGLPVPK